MLSRVANCLYWMSRYIERAENIARIVDVNLQLLLDFRNLDEQRLAEHWLPIVQTTGDETHLFVRSPQAREMWRESPSEFFQQIKASSLHMIGLTYSTLIHNEGWWFTQVGKFIERADKTSRILDVRYQTLPARGVPAQIGQAEALEWSAILRSCSAWDAYKSIYGVEVHPRQVAELLLLNGDFPRSVRFCVGELDRALRRISGMPEGRFSIDAEKLAGRLLAELQFSTIDEIFDQGLHSYLDCLQGKFNAVGDALFNAYIFEAFSNVEGQHLVQQEEQQQQASRLVIAAR
ncbi:MAG: alpha-E domain-containing protein [Verrucomicrobia bacterium]|nr:alpha-E domain-containing protein [Verrucomicrobiota bacterium]